ncbi:MAG TPA: exodeoxyribonuclease VII large subunit, partial [Anaerolineales bacterium]|nr:exodeoxyribonuclease VII large subunit [Anaerolineales bacterium]
LATPNQADLRETLAKQRDELTRTMGEKLSTQRWNLANVQNRLLRQAPRARIFNDRQRLDDLARRADTALSHQMRLRRTRLDGLTQKLTALNPLAILERGYAVVTTPDGHAVRRTSQVSPGDPLTVRVADGTFPARAE